MAKLNLGTKAIRASDVALLSDITSRVGSMTLGSWTAYQISDKTTTSTNPDDTDLMFTLPLGTYAIDAYLYGQTSATGNGPRYSIGSSTSGAISAIYGSVDVNTSLSASTASLITAPNTNYGTNPGTASAYFPVKIHAIITVANASAKVGIRFAGSATTVTSTLKAMSYVTFSAVGTQATAVGAAQRVLTKKDITGAYTLVAADAQDIVLNSTSSSALTITLPVNNVVPVESAIPWRQVGAGQITFAAASGMTLVSRGSVYKSAGQYAGGTVTQISSTTWLLEGDIVA